LLVRAFLWLGLIEAGLAFSGFFLTLAFSSESAIWGANLHVWLPDLLPLGAFPTYFLAITVYHAGVVMTQVGNTFAVRSEINRGRSLGWLSNPYLFGAVGVEIVLILLLIYNPTLASAFQHVPLPKTFWIWLAMYPFILYTLDWIQKAILRWRRNK